MKYITNVCSAWSEVKLFSISHNHQDKQMKRKIRELDKFFAHCQHQIHAKKPCLYKIQYD